MRSGVPYARFTRQPWLDLYAADARDGAYDVLQFYPRNLDAGTLATNCGICREPLSAPSGFAAYFARANDLARFDDALGSFARRRRIGADPLTDAPEALCNGGRSYDVLHVQCLLANAFERILYHNGDFRVCLTESSAGGRVSLRFDALPEDVLWSLVLETAATEPEERTAASVVTALRSAFLRRRPALWAAAASHKLDVLKAIADVGVKPAIVTDAQWALREEVFLGPFSYEEFARAIGSHNVRRIEAHVQRDFDVLATAGGVANVSFGAYADAVTSNLFRFGVEKDEPVVLRALLRAASTNAAFNANVEREAAIAEGAPYSAAVIAIEMALSWRTPLVGQATMPITPLEYMVESGHIIGVDFFDETIDGSLPNERSYVIRTLADAYLGDYERKDLATMLLKRNDFDAGDENSEVLSNALEYNWDFDIVSTLLQRGANARDRNNTMLQAVLAGNDNFFVSKEYDVNAASVIMLMLANGAALPATLSAMQRDRLVSARAIDALLSLSAEDDITVTEARTALETLASTPAQAGQLIRLLASLAIDDFDDELYDLLTVQIFVDMLLPRADPTGVVLLLARADRVPTRLWPPGTAASTLERLLMSADFRRALRPDIVGALESPRLRTLIAAALEPAPATGRVLRLRAPHEPPPGAETAARAVAAYLAAPLASAQLVRERGRWFRHDVARAPVGTGLGFAQRGSLNALEATRGTYWAGYRVLDYAMASFPVTHAWRVLEDGRTVLDRTPLALVESAWYFGITMPLALARAIVLENGIGTEDVLDGIRFLPSDERRAEVLAALRDANPLPDDERARRRQRTSARFSSFAATLLQQHDYVLAYSGPSMASGIARITNARGKAFSVVLASVTDTTRAYKLIDDDAGAQRGFISILALTYILMLDQVGLYASVRGQSLCTPFVTAALRDSLASYGDSPPALARVFVSTDYPRSAVNCYLGAFRAVNYGLMQEPRPIHPAHEEGGDVEYVTELVFVRQ